jgi:hypothetical protein
VLVIVTIIFLGAWIRDRREILPSLKMEKEKLLMVRKNKLHIKSVSNSIPLYKRTKIYSIVPLPDSETPDDKKNNFWKLANLSGTSVPQTSDMQNSLHKQLSSKLQLKNLTASVNGSLSFISQNIQTLNLDSSSISKPNLCGRLCGRVGYGQCKEFKCLCPILFKGNFCMVFYRYFLFPLILMICLYFVFPTTSDL